MTAWGLTPEQRFWAKVNKTETCWLWTAACHKVGSYGDFWDGTKRPNGTNRIVRAHRFAYELLVGPIPAGTEIDHICHVRRCVNPDHLRVTTHVENMQNRSEFWGASGRRGVHLDRRTGRWDVRVTLKGATHYGGSFKTLEEADAAAIALRNELFTHNDADRIAS